MKRYTLAAVAALLVLVPWHETVRASATLYTVQDLGSFKGVAPTISGVNASGQVTGNINGGQAVRYTPGVGWEDIPALGTVFSWASGINAGGDIVGYYINSAGLFRAYRSQGGVVRDIEPLPGDSMTLGFGIDDAGNVVGVSMGAGNHPFRADAVTLTAQLVPSLGATGVACALNAAGQIVGTYNTATGAQHGMRVDPGFGAIDIASLDGPGFTVNACSLDADGRVGGQFDRASGQTHAFRFSATGMIDVDSFGSPLSNIESMAAGVSVGWYSLPDFSSSRAFAHTDADGSFDLNTRIDAAGWVLQTARGVNVNGQIVGEGTLNGAPAAFLLTPRQTADTTPPVIAAHGDETAEATGPNGAVVTYAAPATSDAVDGSGTAACSPASGSTFAVGTTTVTCTASDAAGNAATPTTFRVVVRDTTAPVIAAHGGETAEATGPNGAVVTYAAPATSDAVDGSGTAACSPASGSTFAVGTTTVTCTASDAAGNAATPTTFRVVVTDTTAPDIVSLAASPSFIWPANNKLVAVSLAVSATDAVDASPVCTLTSVTGGPASDIVITGPLSAKVRATKDDWGWSARTYVFQVTCSDKAGNASQAAVTVTVGKDAPSFLYHYSHRRHGWLLGLARAYGRYR